MLSSGQMPLAEQPDPTCHQEHSCLALTIVHCCKPTHGLGTKTSRWWTAKETASCRHIARRSSCKHADPGKILCISGCTTCNLTAACNRFCATLLLIVPCPTSTCPKPVRMCRILLAAYWQMQKAYPIMQLPWFVQLVKLRAVESPAQPAENRQLNCACHIARMQCTEGALLEIYPDAARHIAT